MTDQRLPDKPRIMLVITKADVGGAQKHVLQLLRGQTHTYHFVLVTGSPDYLTREAAEFGIEVCICPDLVRPVKPVSDLRAYSALVQLMKRYQPVLVHAHSFKAGIVARLAALRCRIPAIFTAHGWSFTPGAPRFQRGLGLIIESVLCRTSCAVITISAHDMELARRLKVGPAHRRHLVRNAADFATVKANPLDSPVHLLSIGRVTAVKNQKQLVKAMLLLPVEITLTIVGDGNLRGELENLVINKGLQSRVKLTGEIVDIEQYFAKAQIFVLCSNYEGLPLSILEAMAAGLPVVSTDVGGVSEAVVEGETGLLVPPGNHQALAQRLQELIQQPAKRKSMGERGRALHEAEFTIDRFNRQMQGIYAGVLNNQDCKRRQGYSEIP